MHENRLFVALAVVKCVSVTILCHTFETKLIDSIPFSNDVVQLGTNLIFQTISFELALMAIYDHVVT